MVVNVGIKVFSVALGIYSNRWLNSELGASELTDYNLIIAYTGIIMGLVNLGLPLIIQKFYTNDKTNDKKKIADFWTTITGLRLLTFIPAFLAILFSWTLSGTSQLSYIIAIFAFQFILLADQNYLAVYSSRGQTWKSSITDFCGKILLIGLLIAYPLVSGLIGVSNPLTYFILVSFIGYITIISSDFVWLKKYTPLGKFRLSILKKHKSSIFYLALSGLLISFYQNSNKQFLEFLGYGDQVNGFSNSFNLLMQAVVITGIILPQVSSLVKQKLDKKDVSKVGDWIKKVFKVDNYKALIISEWTALTAAMGVVAYFGMVVFGPIILKLIDKEGLYPVEFEVLPILSIFVIFNSLAALMTYITIFYDKEKYNFIAVAIQAILAPILYLAFIPQFGAVGASWAIVILSIIDFFLLRIPLLIKAIR